jgi:type I restriction enzyme, S subunit
MSKVPVGWEKKLLKDILKVGVKNGYSPNAVDYETGHWVLSLAALGDDGINTNGIKPVLPTDNVLNSQLIPGDFLVSRSNTPDKVGRSIKFRGEVKNCSYPDLMMKFRVDTNLAIENFIEQALKGSVVRQYYKSCAAGSSSSMVKINKSIVEKTPLLIPPLPEQTKIAQILSTWDKAISTTEQLIGNSQQQKKALMQSLLTGKTRLPGFEGELINSTLENACYINPKKASRPEDGLVSFISMESVSEDAKLIRAEVRNYDDVEKGFTSFSDNDVLVAKITPCFENGKGAYLDELKNGVGFGSTEFHVLRAKKNTYSKFVYYVTNTDEFRVRGEANLQGSAGQKRVTTDYLKQFPLKLPPLPEQQKIAAVLTAADNEIELLQNKLAFLKQEKNALMQQLLTGKRRVKINATEECMDA